jgi:hypothetical protein
MSHQGDRAEFFGSGHVTGMMAKTTKALHRTLQGGVGKAMMRLHYPAGVILLSVRRGVAYSPSLRNPEEMPAGQGIRGDHPIAHRRVMWRVPLRARAFRARERLPGPGWRMDEPYVNPAGLASAGDRASGRARGGVRGAHECCH